MVEREGKVMAENFLLTQIAFELTNHRSVWVQQRAMVFVFHKRRRQLWLKKKQKRNETEKRKCAKNFFSCCTTRKDCILMRNGYFRARKKNSNSPVRARELAMQKFKLQKFHKFVEVGWRKFVSVA